MGATTMGKRGPFVLAQVRTGNKSSKKENKIDNYGIIMVPSFILRFRTIQHD